MMKQERPGDLVIKSSGMRELMAMLLGKLDPFMPWIGKLIDSLVLNSLDMMHSLHCLVSHPFFIP